MSRYWSKLRCLKGGWVTLNANLRGKRASPPTIFGTRKVESLGYRMVKKIAEKFNRLSRVHQRYRQTNRQTTDGIATASSERKREFTSAKNDECVVTDGSMLYSLSRFSLVHTDDSCATEGWLSCDQVII